MSALIDRDPPAYLSTPSRPFTAWTGKRDPCNSRGKKLVLSGDGAWGNLWSTWEVHEPDQSRGKRHLHKSDREWFLV